MPAWGEKSLHPADCSLRLAKKKKKCYISDVGLELCFHSEIREKLEYLAADVSCACELILLFYVVFCLVVDGLEFEFGLVVN
jgi:hypothetical protein